MNRSFPSIERLMVDLLPEVTMGAHVTAELPHDFQSADGKNFLLPIVVIDRIAGANLDYMLDRPIVDIDVYAADRLTAQDIAENIRTFLIFDLPARRVPYNDYGVVFTRTRVVVAPRTLPHANPIIRRYSANYEFVLHTSP